MLTGWQKAGDKWYYLSPVPEANTWNYNIESGKWVYGDDGSRRPYGSLYVNSFTPDNYYVDSDGALVQ